MSAPVSPRARARLRPWRVAPGPPAALAAALVAEMSTWEDHSDITANRAARCAPAAGWHVLTQLALAEESGGAHDPTVGPLVNAWGFGPHQRAFEPLPAAVEAAARAAAGDA